MSSSQVRLEVNTPDEWHVLKGDQQYGPYSYSEMIQMLQQKVLHGYDYAWASHYETWAPLQELAEFTADRLHRVAEKNEDDKSPFEKRKHLRIFVSRSVYCHDDERFWLGKIENLSRGGALILMENPTLIPGGFFHLHFRRESPTDHPFNTKAEILSKRLVRSKIRHDTKVHYAVRFDQITPEGQKQIERWVEEYKKKESGNG